MLVELKARFDEENNIVWAKMLEKGRLPCHLWSCRIKDPQQDHARAYVAKKMVSADICIWEPVTIMMRPQSFIQIWDCLPATPSIGEDATAVFNMLSGYSEPLSWNKLSLAPLWLKDRFLYLIEREMKHAKAGEKGHIIAKVNSLCDKDSTCSSL